MEITYFDWIVTYLIGRERMFLVNNTTIHQHYFEQ